MRTHPAVLREPVLTTAPWAEAAAFAASTVGCGVISRLGWLDTPGARSSHARPTRTGGGAAIAAAFALGALMLGGAGLGPAERAAGAGALLLAALGAADDRLDLPAGPKLLAVLVAAAAVALVTPAVPALPVWPGYGLGLAPPLAIAGATVWLVTVANAVNFMDGANGLVGGGLAIAFAALAAACAGVGAPLPAAWALLAAAAYLGFLPWNLAGRLFQGDAGSLFGGFLFAALCLMATARGLPLLFGPIALLPWLTDVLLTLLRRAKGHRALWKAHSEHLYQRWLRAGSRPHAALAAANAALMAAAAAAALCAAGWPRLQAPVFLVMLGACVTGWRVTSRRIDAAA